MNRERDRERDKDFKPRKQKCRFCREKIDVVDYKDVRSLQKLSTPQGKLLSRKRTGNCATHQRQVKAAVKRARFLALLPYIAQ